MWLGMLRIQEGTHPEWASYSERFFREIRQQGSGELSSEQILGVFVLLVISSSDPKGGPQMLQKCANPRCGEPFRSLKQGKLFSFPSPDGVQHYWLCFICSRKLKINVTAAGRATIVKQAKTSAAAAA
jgi:hypothetical protein